MRGLDEIVKANDEAQAKHDAVKRDSVQVYPPYDQTGAIIAYEQGELDGDATIELFQHLIDSGLAWQLQGHYGRTAAALIENGDCHR